MTTAESSAITLEPNKIAAEFVQANLEKALNIAGRQVKGARNLIRLRLERTYSEYIGRLLRRHSRAKSFFVRTEPIPLYDFFVPLDVATDRRRVDSASATAIAAVAPFAILTGSGGSGKSMVMRHLLLSALTSREKTPVFLELRQVDLSEVTLEDALLGALTDNGLDVDAQYFGLALAEGHFLILLDGFDELDKRGRAKASKAVQRLAEKYPNNWIVLTSRPDPELEGWTAFTVFRVEPLDLQKAVALVDRLAFDEEIKARFIKDLRGELFERHKSFLSNPLLLSIMLLTYHDTAHIPSKLSVFYNQAYESLFQKHDALKGGYQRHRLTTVDIQDFARVFAAFCIRTYSKRQFTFALSQVLEELERCRELTQIDFEPQDFATDAKQAVCLLVEEGSDLAFAHRSFQEYFAARFIAHAPPQLKAQLIRRFGASVGTDAVIPLLHEIDPYAVEQYYVLPMLERLRGIVGVKRTVGVTHYRRYLPAVFNTFHFEHATSHFSATIADIALFHAMEFIWRRYGRRVLSVGRSDYAEWQQRLTEALGRKWPADRDVSVRAAVSDSEVRSVLQDAGDRVFGIQYLRDLMAIESDIRARHRAAEGSLDAILG